jgi:hypothetical protein
MFERPDCQILSRLYSAICDVVFHCPCYVQIPSVNYLYTISCCKYLPSHDRWYILSRKNSLHSQHTFLIFRRVIVHQRQLPVFRAFFEYGFQFICLYGTTEHCHAKLHTPWQYSHFSCLRIDPRHIRIVSE